MGCQHYHSPLDILSIKFRCCGRYYPCHLCHAAAADHPLQQWKLEEHHTKAILCGHCNTELTISQYLACNSQCPHCKAPFNPKCKSHWSLYFQYKCPA